MNLLLVDDDTLSLHALNRALTLSGFDCIAVDTPEAALETLAESRLPAAVIADVKMPNMNGVELARIIQRDYPTVPVILMTAFIEHESLLQCEESCVSGLILKPIRIEELVDMILEVRARTLTERQRDQRTNSDIQPYGGTHG